MEKSPNNPATNDLPGWLSDETVEETIYSSDYPLRALVASKLRPLFTVVEDWGFIDRDTPATKCNLDLLAFSDGEKNQTQPSLSPGMDLFIKCKRSELPFLFFKSVTQSETRNFPLIHGFRSNFVEVQEGNTIRFMPNAGFLGLGEHTFTSSDVAFSNVFNRTSRRGSALDMSANEANNSVMLPLISAMEYRRSMLTPRNAAISYPSLALGLCVLDAPMVLVDAMKPSDAPTLTPWVRVMRQEVNPDKNSGSSHREFYIDVVHFGFLEEFIRQHLVPFADFFYARVKEKGGTLLSKSS